MSEAASSESSWSRYLSLRYATRLVEERGPPRLCSTLSNRKLSLVENQKYNQRFGTYTGTIIRRKRRGEMKVTVTTERWNALGGMMM